MLRGIFNLFVNYFLSNLPFCSLRNFIYGLIFKIEENANILMGVRFLSNNITIGANSIINYGCLLDGRGAPIHIGNNVDIAPYVRLWTLSHEYNSQNHATISGAIVIGDYAWIASGATILPGVTIGKGAVIATGAVVTKDVADYTVVAGNPAKVVNVRSNDIIYSLNYHPWFY